MTILAFSIQPSAFPASLDTAIFIGLLLTASIGAACGISIHKPGLPGSPQLRSSTNASLRAVENSREQKALNHGKPERTASARQTAAASNGGSRHSRALPFTAFEIESILNARQA